MRGAGIVGLGIGISLDELAIGFGLGLLRLPLLVLVVLQAFGGAQLGIRLGTHLSEETRGWAECIAALLLITAGALIEIERVAR